MAKQQEPVPEAPPGDPNRADTMSSSAAPARRVARLEVKDLFGQYDYCLPSTESSKSLDDVVILYGDNGSGKTTLLKLLFHLLSAANDRGHRSALYQIPFSSFEVTLSDGARVSARRKGIAGRLRLDVDIPGGPSVSGTYIKKGDETFESPEFERSYISALAQLNLTLYYLTDSRQLVSDSIGKRIPDAARQWRRAVRRQLTKTIIVEDDDEDDESDGELGQTLTRTHEWIRRQLIRASNIGSENANTIYVEILRQLAQRAPLPNPDKSAQELTELLKDLRATGSDFSRFGFSPQLDVEQMLGQLSAATPQRRDMMVTILEPYIRGVAARLESLSTINTSTTKLVDGLTSFFSGGKHVEFDVATGFRFLSANGAKLRPSWLSSGEQHLVKLFCCTLISRDSPSVFLVDEPELSLNIKWQRVLVEALSGLAEGSPNQFFFSTHSIEILAKHRNAVLQLEPS